MDPASVEIFRAKLQSILDNVDGDEPYHKGVRSVVRALKADFDVLFPQDVWGANDRTHICRLMEKYCNRKANLCPICGGPLRQRVSRMGRQFLGCQRYPVCKGSRSIEGSPTINDAMREFLSKKVSEDLLEQQKQDGNRFRNLDL